MNQTHRMLAGLIFSSRWLQAPLYIGLIVSLAVCVWQFARELIHLLMTLTVLTENEVLLITLSMIDIVMVANLLVMVIVGGYETFVSRLRMDDHPDSPEWLSHVNANTMKIKLSLALIGISSIHLLRSFIDIEHLTTQVIVGQVGIHLTFLVSALCLAYTSKIAQDVKQID